MGKWIVVGVLILLYVPGFALLAVPGNFYSKISLDWLAPKKDVAQAKDYVEAVRKRDFTPVEKALAHKFVTPKLPAMLTKLAEQFPPGKPVSVRLVNYDWKSVNGQKTTRLTLEYDYPSASAVAEVMLRSRGGKTILYGLHVVPVNQSLAKANAFTFAGKSPMHYGVAVAMAIAFFFTLISVFYCMKTPIPRFKWVWVIFVLVGFVTLHFNWTTGYLSVQPISFLLCSVGFREQPMGPVIMELSIPLGAILFWFRRRRWLEAAENAARTEPFTA